MTENKDTYFELKYNGDFIKIELINFAYPDADSDWDRDWINSTVTVKAGGFSGQFDCYFMSTDFERFKKEFTQLYTKLNETASFDTLEEQLRIKIKGDGIGHFEADCLAMDYPGTGNTLEFQMTFDQTIIPGIVSQLDTITRTFPVLREKKTKHD